MNLPPSLPSADTNADALDATPVQGIDEGERSRALSTEGATPPGHVPGYELQRRLGEGSFGSVWLARELKTGKQVAIKFYTHRRGLDWSLLSREVEKLAVLYTSRNIVELLDVGWDHEPPYFVMEYLQSGSLADRLQSGVLTVDESTQIARDIARALVHAHSSGILHCDLKPANVLLDGNGDARLGDFGQSRLTTEQSPALGTLFYMAPEQAVTDGVPDARWDVYALGALMYQMLTGSPPYRTDDAKGRIEQADSLESRLTAYRLVLRTSPPPSRHRQVAGVDRRLAKIIDQCLEQDANLRIKSPQVVLDLLDQRDALRAKRPLVALGFLGPVLFLIAVYWIANTVIPSVVETAEKNLINRALASDIISARILAASVQQELQVRQDTLASVADLPAVREVIRRSSELSRDELIRDLVRAAGSPLETAPAPPEVERREASDAEREEMSGKAGPGPVDVVVALMQKTRDKELYEKRTPDESWFITDQRGRQVLRLPLTENTIGKQFHWRDYFHGQGRELDPEIEIDSVSIRQVPGISAAFQSRATDQYMVAISVPVWDESHKEVIGILASTIHLTDLLKQWEVRIRSLEEPLEKEGHSQSDPDPTHHRFLALADTRGGEVRLLDHPWMTPQNLGKISDAELESTDSPLRMVTPFDSVLLEEHWSTEYADPLARRDPDFAGQWLAAAAPVGNTGWIAVVQERRDVALKPVDELRRVFVRAGFSAICVFSLLLGLLWYLIHRASN
ncbi:MAG: protein kinase [Planctomycetaceae bacterium]